MKFPWNYMEFKWVMHTKDINNGKMSHTYKRRPLSLTTSSILSEDYKSQTCINQLMLEHVSKTLVCAGLIFMAEK